MKKQMTCIICPRGCMLLCSEGQDGFDITGNACPKGKDYAIAELTHPTRTVTSVVRVAGENDAMVSVKTATPIPKEKMMEVMEQIKKITVTPPVEIGNIILENVFGTNIIATKAVTK